MSYFGSRYSLLAASVPFSSNPALRGGGERQPHPAAWLLRYPAKGKELYMVLKTGYPSILQNHTSVCGIKLIAKRLHSKKKNISITRLASVK